MLLLDLYSMFNQLSFTYFIFIPVLAIILLLLNYILAVSKPDIQKISTYESGFEPIPNITSGLYTVIYTGPIIIFLIFDTDITLMFPLVSIINTNIDIISNFEIFIGIISTVIFIIGLAFDLIGGILDFTKNK
jgi:NADH-ubiquinone oxidoreductase chain 3